MSETALFIPLRAYYFNRFKDRTKTQELRRYGRRWNEGTCTIGRAVSLSCGYSGPRLAGVVTSFQKLRASELSPAEQRDLWAIYGREDIDVAVIGVRVAW